MEDNTNKLHFKCTDFNSSMRVTVYSECVYVFLSKILFSSRIPCWLLKALLWRLLWWISGHWCHKLIAKVNKC